MLKREFYDVITVIGFVLVIAISILMSGITFSRIIEGAWAVANTTLLSQLIISAIVFIYWAFILVLAINLYTRGSLILIEVVLVGVLIPFSPITYLLLLRKPLREYQEENPPKRKKKSIGNVPGTP